MDSMEKPVLFNMPTLISNFDNGQQKPGLQKSIFIFQKTNIEEFV